MIVRICYFLKSIKVFILVQCNTTLSKNYGAHSYVTVVCVIGWIWEKNWFICTPWLSVHMKSVVEQGFSTNSHLTTKCLKHLSNFESDENVRSLNVVEFEFELYHILPLKQLSLWCNRKQVKWLKLLRGTRRKWRTWLNPLNLQHLTKRWPKKRYNIVILYISKLMYSFTSY